MGLYFTATFHCLFPLYHARKGRPTGTATDPTVVHTVTLRLIHCTEAAQ